MRLSNRHIFTFDRGIIVAYWQSGLSFRDISAHMDGLCSQCSEYGLNGSQKKLRNNMSDHNNSAISRVVRYRWLECMALFVRINSSRTLVNSLVVVAQRLVPHKQLYIICQSGIYFHDIHCFSFCGLHDLPMSDYTGVAHREPNRRT